MGKLIDQQKKLNNLSNTEIAARAEERGEKLGKSNIQRVASGDNPSLSRATIFGLAAGLGITPATVARAALADMGIMLTEPESDAEAAIKTDPTLSEHGRRLLLAMLSEIKSGPDSGKGPLLTGRGSVMGKSSASDHQQLTKRASARRK
ncbi:hypothetical protein [Nocardia brasiliensis]|uniref:hypothetical protein n=1 Tax=Nocardia brasiliensis TaxID=37326 RepID=UPI002455CB14|nr:hypothetical protein [Nocardia brasiliensis]